MLIKTGIPTPEQVDSVFPSDERLAQGPCVVVECYQNIPCNPCFTACKRGGIKPFTDINNLPDVDHEACNGCTLCVSNCPGLAIMVVDANYSETECVIRIPYEFIPLPEAGQTVDALDRAGEFVCKAKVVRVMNAKFQDKTPVVWLAFDKSFMKQVRNFSIPKNKAEDSIVCRCSDLSMEEIRSLIADGYDTIDELKRILRLGMGPCQGRTCVPLVMREIAMATGTPIAEVNPGTYRPPVKAVKLGEILDAIGEGEE